MESVLVDAVSVDEPSEVGVFPEPNECAYYVRWLNTPLQNGNTYEAVRLDWTPLVQSLATGTVPGDRYDWSFEDAPFYADAESLSTAKRQFELQTENMQPRALAALLCGASIGVYDLYDLEYTYETRKIEGEDGKKLYRCAMTGVSVKNWRSPYGAICSRNEALRYYNKCQKQIELVVSKIRKARQPNGKPLTTPQQIKWVHDWLINSADYAYNEANEYFEDPNGANKYRHIFNEYGAIIEGRAVCQSYSYAFEAIVEELARQTGSNIKCEEAHDSDHSWNRVKLDGKWYHVDVTQDEDGKLDFTSEFTDTVYFLISDSTLQKKRKGNGKYTSYTSSTEKATDRKYEGKQWVRYKKDFSECTIVFRKPNKVYTYKGKKIIPSVVVKYGSNVIPRDAYVIKRADKLKAGNAKVKAKPRSYCYALNGSVTSSVFYIAKGQISGTAKSRVKYKLGKSKSVCPFNKTFKPFASTYKYAKRPKLAKSASKSLTLKKGVDYVVKYKNNKKPGQATAIIKMKGGYTGTVKIRFRIVK